MADIPATASDPQDIPKPTFGWRFYIGLPNTGIWHLCLDDAALLVALDMWHEGILDDIADSQVNPDPNGPELREALRPVIADLLARLIAAVENNKLEAVVQRAWIAESLLTDRTFVTHEDLRKWLRQYGYEFGKFAEQYEAEIRKNLVEWAEGVAFMKYAWRHAGALPTEFTEAASQAREGSGTLEDITSALERATAHIALLRRELAEREEASGPSRAVERTGSSLGTRPRTYLRVIAALCKLARIDYNARGIAGAISAATDDISAHVDEESIRPILKAIPDALGDPEK